MELRQLQYFIVVYEEGSVTKAASRLNVVQPALSQQISKLEEELGRPLFLRTAKGMVPTETGAQAYTMFSSILGDLRNAKLRLEESDGQVRGRVSIGTVTSVANNALAETLLSFQKKYPDVQIRATDGYTPDLLELHRNAQLDIIVINAALPARSPNMIDIIQENFALIGAPASGIGLPMAVPIDYHRVAELKLVLPSVRHGLRNILDAAASANDFVLQPQMEFDDIKVIEDFVAGSDFFTLLPPIAVHRALYTGRLRLYSITPAIPRRLVYVTSPERPLTRAAQLLIDELRERMIDFSYDISVTLTSDRLQP